MKNIPLTKGKVAIVDDEDFESLSKYKWCFDGRYAQRRANGKAIRMHSVLIKTPKGMHTDHINRNELDNRKSNLRVVTPTINHLNMGIPKHNTSGVKGVVWDKQTDKWRSQIQIMGKGIPLGRFTNIEDAAEARVLAERKYNVAGR